MTLIAAVQHGGEVWMLGDSIGAGTESGTYSLQREPKVIVLGDLLVGYSTSFRFGQILQHSLKLPPRKAPIEVWLRSTFIDRVRKTLETHGFGDGKNGSGGFLLIATEGRIFTVQEDFAVLECTLPYAAVGSGVSHACGALAALRAHGQLTPQEQLVAAGQATAQHMMWVAPPWHLRRSSDPGTLITVPA